MSKIKVEDLYVDDLFEGKSVLIGCDSKVWQNVVWHSAIAVHYENYIGSFYLIDDTIKQEYLEDNGEVLLDIDYSGWNIYDGSNSGYIHTDHVIDIKRLWLYVEKQLSLFGISYERRLSDYDAGLNPDEVGLCEAVLKYMQYLSEGDYVVDLETRMGHVDEHSFKLAVVEPGD